MAILGIERVYYAECAHRLTAGVPEGHKCRRLHGHTYEIRLFVDGALDGGGLVLEYEALDRVVKPIIKLVDHYDLNTLNDRCTTVEAGWLATNPTVEYLALWLGMRLCGIVASARRSGKLRLRAVRVQEGADARASSWWRAEPHE